MEICSKKCIFGDIYYRHEYYRLQKLPFDGFCCCCCCFSCSDDNIAIESNSVVCLICVCNKTYQPFCTTPTKQYVTARNDFYEFFRRIYWPSIKRKVFLSLGFFFSFKFVRLLYRNIIFSLSRLLLIHSSRF